MTVMFAVIVGIVLLVAIDATRISRRTVAAEPPDHVSKLVVDLSRRVTTRPQARTES